MFTLRQAGQLCGVELPPPGRRVDCPFRNHAHKKNFSVFLSKTSGEELWKCWSCDPPENVGDSIAFFARFNSLERKDAIAKLAKEGYLEPRNSSPGWSPRPVPPVRRDDVPKITGTKTDSKYIILPPSDWVKWKKAANGQVTAFASIRGIRPEVLFENDVVQIGHDLVGFGYRNPENMIPCRVKVRAISKKMFWIEPKGNSLAPLYLSHRLIDLPESNSCIIVEGEVDALTMLSLGYRHVVSLPDGSESAKTVDLTPIAHRYRHWLISVDDDDPGDKAYSVLKKRASIVGADPVRVRWKSVTDAGDIVSYKDANDAMNGVSKTGRTVPMTREDFDHCIKMQFESCLGIRVDLESL